METLAQNTVLRARYVKACIDRPARRAPPTPARRPITARGLILIRWRRATPAPLICQPVTSKYVKGYGASLCGVLFCVNGNGIDASPVYRRVHGS